ncbi:MAG: NifB/NifX family molybdenum-iron cluster-binding protein [Candidatus Thorarchaeota archaeon]
MIVAISTNGQNLDGNVDSRFGRCGNFLLYDVTNSSIKVIENAGQYEGHGAGVTAAQKLVDAGVNVVISGNIGPNAFDILRSANISMYAYIGTIRAALDLLRENRLETLTSPRKGPMSGVGKGRGVFKG